MARLLGSGGTSRVFEVLDVRSGRRLALKQSNDRQGAQRARGAALFRQEFHVLLRIAHPNVVSVFEYGADNGRDAAPNDAALDGPAHRVAGAVAASRRDR